MTTLLKGADSAYPQPELVAGREIWGVYVAGATPHVWTRQEVSELGTLLVLPIVVPPQDHPWWEENDGYPTLEALVREAAAWGLPNGSPLVLDVEEAQAELIGQGVYRSWAIACDVHKFIPWTYGNATAGARDLWGKHWLALWPSPTPADPELPAGCAGWQYQGGAEGDKIDLDVFDADETYLTAALEVRPAAVPVAPAVAPPAEESAAGEAGETPVAEGAETEIPKVLSAIHAEVSAEEATPSPSRKALHASQIRTHAEELLALADELER